MNHYTFARRLFVNATIVVGVFSLVAYATPLTSGIPHEEQVTQTSQSSSDSSPAPAPSRSGNTTTIITPVTPNQTQNDSTQPAAPSATTLPTSDTDTLPQLPVPDSTSPSYSCINSTCSTSPYRTQSQPPAPSSCLWFMWRHKRSGCKIFRRYVPNVLHGITKEKTHLSVDSFFGGR